MKWLSVFKVVLVLALLWVPSGLLYAQVTVEIVAEGDGVTQQTATEKDILLVLPKRFFRARGETAFSEPYIAELSVTTDNGATWETYGIFKDLDKPFEFTASEEGRYGFFVTIVDRKGNPDTIPGPGTKPQVKVLVDWTPPVIELDAPVGGELVGGADSIEIKWRAMDLFPAEFPITLECSWDGGKTWEAFAEGVADTGSFTWKPPAASNGRVLIRATVVDEAGHCATTTSASGFLVDTALPTAALVGPTLAARERVALDIVADDGEGSGITEYTLWVSHDRGMNWAPAGKTSAGQAVVFSSTKGTYGLSISAVDRAGNASQAPRSGDAPQISLSIDGETPLVRLKTLSAGDAILSGGLRIPIQWEAVSRDPAPKPVAIHFSADGGNSWRPVALDIDNTGELYWNVPGVNSSNCMLKVSMRDSSGAVGAAQSARPFQVDSTRPVSAIGLAPSKLDGEPADLAVVLRPLTGEAAEAVEPEEAEEPEETDVPAREVPEQGFVPQPTEAPSAPWSKAKPEPYAQPPGDDAGFEDVLKAGFAAYKANRLHIAKDYFQRAAKLAPEDPRPHAGLGRIYARLSGFSYTSKKESFEAALYEFDKALSLSGGDADVLNDKGFALLQTKRYKDAEKTLRKAVATVSKSVYWYNLGLALYNQKKKSAALDAFLKAVEIEPRMKEAHFYLGRIYGGLRKWQEAKEHWQKAADGFGADDRLGKAALAGLQEAREALGEISREPDGVTWRERFDRIR